MGGLGTLINLAAIVAGTATGLLVGHRIPERARSTMLQAVGLVTLALGVSEVLDTHNLVFPLVAVVLGGLAGELTRIEDGLESLGERIRRRVERPVDPEVEGASVAVEAPPPDPSPTAAAETVPPQTSSGSSFVEGFVAASLLFCIGPLAILGSIQDGLAGDIELLVVKSALDGLVSVIFAATLGWGVGFSVLPVAVYQGVITLAAGSADRLLTERMIAEMTATGGLLVMGIALRLLDLKHVRVGSLLPALVIAPLLVAGFAR